MKLIVFLSLILFSFSLACLNCRKRKTCEDGWTQINRTLGVWCVKVLASDSVLNYSQATSMCNELGAVLSSIESQAEYEIELGLINSLNVTNAYLGSQLTAACNCATANANGGCPITDTCTFSTAFEWTDNFTVGTSVIGENESALQKIIPALQAYLVIYENYISDSNDYGLIELDEAQEGNDDNGALCGKRPS